MFYISLIVAFIIVYYKMSSMDYATEKKLRPLYGEYLMRKGRETNNTDDIAQRHSTKGKTNWLFNIVPSC